MWKATVKGILARRVRLALTALAVLLGVSFVSGTYVLTDTLDSSFEGAFRQSVSGIDLVVRLRAPFGGDTGRDRFPDSALERVRDVDGVASAQGFLQDYAQFVGTDGQSIQTGGAPTFGISWAQHGDDGPLRLIPDGNRVSRRPHGRGEVAMDYGTARAHDFHVGDRVRVLLEGPAREFTISGLFGFGSRTEIGSVTFAAFDLATAQRVFDAPGLVDAVNVTAEPGVALRTLRRNLSETLGPTFEVDNAQEIAEDRSREVMIFVDLLTQLLLGFAAIGIVVGAFIIFNTFTILVAQRTRELGLLRAMGASGRQVVASVVAEAAVVGASASVVGLALGVGLAGGLLALVEALGRDVPEGPLVLADRTIALSVGLGVMVTMVSSLGPALRAARVPPVAAISGVVVAPARPFRLRVALGTLLLAGAVPLLVVGLERTRDSTDALDEIWLVALGALLVFFGVVSLLAPFSRRLAGFLGRPLRAFDVTGALARGNAMRNPRRTAATASALVVGLGLVGLVAVFAESAKASVSAAVDRGIRADVVLKAQHFVGFSPEVAERLAKARELDAVAAFRFGNVRVSGNEETVAGVDPRELAAVVDLRMVSGRVGAMADDGALVHVDTAREYEVGSGDTLLIQFPRGFGTVRVVGIYEQEDFTGGFPVPLVVAKDVYEHGFGTDEQDSLVYVKSAGSVASAKRAVERALRDDFPNVEVLTRSEYRDSQERAIDHFLAVALALLLLSEVIAVLGIVNTLALSVHERTHELGLLRSVGMSRRQVRRMVRGESVIIAVIGGAFGIAIGLFWGWAFVTSLHSQGLTQLRVPLVQVGLFLVASLVAGIGAALIPAWRASRLDVLGAIATE